MSITKYYPNGEGTDPVYDIGTEGLEHASTGTLGFIADIFRATYPKLVIRDVLQNIN